MTDDVSLKDQIFEALSRQKMSIADLTSMFMVTRNTVVVHLRQLEASGLVSRMPAERRGTVGKPTTLYAAAGGNEDRNSSAYPPFAEMQARGLASILTEEQRVEFYKQIGEAKAKAVGLSDDLKFSERLTRAQKFADDLGAALSVEETEDHFVLSSFTCPIASVVRAEPCACHALAQIFEVLTGRPTKQCCRKDDKLVCRFEIAK